MGKLKSVNISGTNLEFCPQTQNTKFCLIQGCTDLLSQSV